MATTHDESTPDHYDGLVAGAGSPVTLNPTAASARSTAVAPTIPPVMGATAWYDATQLTGLVDGQAVSTWPDLSGNGFNLSTTSSASPIYASATAADLINGHPTVFFEGTSNPNYMDAQGWNTLYQPNIVYLVCYPQASDGAQGRVIDANINTNANRQLVDVLSGSSPNFDYVLQTGNYVDSTRAGTATAIPEYVTVQFVSASTSLRVNGAPVALTANPPNLDSTPMGSLRVGADPNGVGHFLGPIGEILIFPGVHSSSQVSSMEAYLAQKWGLPLQASVDVPNPATGLAGAGSAQVTGNVAVNPTGIALDSVSDGNIGFNTTELTWNHTCSGSNRYLLVGLFGAMGTASDSVSGVTYAGVAMTPLGEAEVPSDRRVYLYGLANPALGTNPVVISCSSSTDAVAAHAVSFTGVSSGDAGVTNAASSVTSITAAVTAGVQSWIAGVAKNENSQTMSFTGGMVRIQRYDLAAFDSGASVPAGAENATVTWPQSENAAIIATVLNPAFVPSGMASAQAGTPSVTTGATGAVSLNAAPGSASAQAPTPSVGGEAAVAAVSAPASAQAGIPSVTTGAVSLNAAPGSASAQAPTPSVSAGAAVAAVSAPASAQAGTPSVTTTGGASSAVVASPAQGVANGFAIVGPMVAEEGATVIGGAQAPAIVPSPASGQVLVSPTAGRVVVVGGEPTPQSGSPPPPQQIQFVGFIPIA